jgi:hypothetical protein
MNGTGLPAAPGGARDPGAWREKDGRHWHRGRGPGERSPRFEVVGTLADWLKRLERES